MEKRWNIRANRIKAADPTGQYVLLKPLLADILAARGIESAADIQSFLSPSLSEMIDPNLMQGMSAAVERLLKARINKETVCVYGDYDVDGISGTALLVSFLRITGFTCNYFIPNRFDDGYGLNIESIERIIALGATLIVSVDCGITAVDEAIQCRTRGADLIIVDHHTPKDQIPDACAVINPLQSGCLYPFKFLAGVGVAFNLLVALRAALREAGAFTDNVLPDLREWLDLVALGTIADVVPLIGQNRMYAYHGLKQLTCSVKPGIVALKRVAGIQDAVSCGQVGFRLAPRLNAAGRMESAVPGVDLLLSKDPEESSQIAADLDAANAERQAIERRIFDEADAMIHSANKVAGHHSIVLASTEWHQGVVGIVASRLVERYHRPVILIALSEDGIGKGSGRSIPGFHLLDALTSCSQYLDRFGGHRYAAGVGLRAENVLAFAESFEVEAARMLTECDLIPILDIDAEVQPADITPELAADLKRLEPFGAGNPEPVLMMREMTVVERRVVGEGHVRLRLTRDKRTFTAIAFRMAEREIAGKIDIAFFPEINEWKGSSTVQLRIKDLRTVEMKHAT
jgi:single-stranded-DNA-specific exonuclease